MRERFRPARRFSSLALVAGLIGACAAADGTGPFDVFDSDAAIVADGVRVTLSLTADVIDPPGTITAQLTYENLGSRSVNVVSSYGCLSFASVYRGDTRISFSSTDYGCTAAVSARELRPGSPLTMQWPLEIGVGLRPGVYRFVADLNTHPQNLERTFIVR